MTREWNGSLVMEEFAKIAAKSGLITTDFDKPIVGNSNKSPVGPFRNNPSVSGKTDTLSVDSNSKDYGVTKETGEELVDEAHPEDPRIAESMGRGWEVENIVQQQEQDIGVATRMPSGALYGKHAELVGALVRLADKLDEEGRKEAAKRIDRAIGRISRLPFNGGLRKEAIGFLAGLLGPLKTLLWGGAALWGGATFGPALLAKLTSSRENLATDIGDVLEVAGSVREDDPSLSTVEGRLRTLLSPFAVQFRKPMPTPGDETGLREYLGLLEEFGTRVLTDARALVTAMTAVRGGWWEGIGFGPKSRLIEKMKDMEETFQGTMMAVRAAAKVGEKLPEAAKAEVPSGGNIAEIQALLAERGLKISQSGKLDDATVDALKQLELRIDVDLRRDPRMAEILERRGWSVAGSLLRPDGKTVDVDTVRRLLALADRAAGK